MTTIQMKDILPYPSATSGVVAAVCDRVVAMDAFDSPSTLDAIVRYRLFSPQRLSSPNSISVSPQDPQGQQGYGRAALRPPPASTSRLPLVTPTPVMYATA